MQKTEEPRRRSRALSEYLTKKSSVDKLHLRLADSENSISNMKVGSQTLQQKLDVYLMQNRQYDKFFSSLYSIADGIDMDCIIETHVMESIKNTQLRE